MEKPRFGKTCREISFGEKLEMRKLSVKKEFEELKKANFVMYSYFIVFNLIGLAVITGSILLFRYMHSIGSGTAVFMLPIVIGAAGIVVIRLLLLP